MGRLVIAHHKSYHPYKAENIERVRRDEELAQQEEEREASRLRLAESEARIDLLRKRAGLKKNEDEEEKQDEDIPLSVKNSVQLPPALSNEVQPNHEPTLTKGGHINLFADLEDQEQSLQNAIQQASKKHGKGKNKADDEGDTDKGIRLAPSQADRTPWYTKEKEGPSLPADEIKMKRDERIKTRHDPLTEIKSSLRKSTSQPGNTSNSSKSRPPVPVFNSDDPARAERLKRESLERARAAELIARRKREQERGSETPSTVSGGTYRNLYNREDVEDARRRRDNVRNWRNNIEDRSGWDGRRESGRRW